MSGRRLVAAKNAVDLVTTTANKIATIDVSVVPLVHEATRLKIATLLMKCMDIPVWKSPLEREKIYKKLYPLIEVMQTL